MCSKCVFYSWETRRKHWLSTWNWGLTANQYFPIVKARGLRLHSCMKNTLVACLLFIAAMCLVMQVSWLKETVCLPLLARSKPHITPTPNQNSNSVCYSPHREQLLDKSYFMEQFKVSQKCLFTDEKLQGTCCGTNLKLGLLGKSYLWKLGSCGFIADRRTSGGLIPIHCSKVCG